MDGRGCDVERRLATLDGARKDKKGNSKE